MPLEPKHPRCPSSLDSFNHAVRSPSALNEHVCDAFQPLMMHAVYLALITLEKVLDTTSLCNGEAMEELTTTFRYNDAVIRNLVIRRDEAVTEESLIMKSEKEDRERKSRYQERQAAEAKAAEAEAAEEEASDEAAEEAPAETDSAEEE